ncbi:MAG: hypothetical protein PHO26_09895 [Dehalococcoidia bacterium]|nr:hypothetical protein [Dehalococcoidia bacterium]
MVDKDIKEIADALLPYDLKDTLSKIAALHLLPENASHAVRLEALTYAAACNDYKPSLPQITRKKFWLIVDRHLGARCGLSMLEDPCDNMFTESMTFFGGDYTVFPGIAENPTFILRNLCKGLFLSPENLVDKKQFENVAKFIIAVLTLSDKVAQACGIKRGTAPAQYGRRDNIYIPNDEKWQLLQRAVWVSGDDISKLLRERRIDEKELDKLMVQPGRYLLRGTYNPLNSKLSVTPIVKAADGVVVAVPQLLLTSLLLHVAKDAIRGGTNETLVEAFREALWDNTKKSLRMLDIFQIDIPGHSIQADKQFKDGLFTFDSDKAIYVQLMSDNLGGLSVDEPARPWDPGILPELLEKRHDAVYQELLTEQPHFNDILWLILVQPIARGVSFTMKEPASQHDLMLALSVSDLETLCQLEGEDRLSLWKYAKQKERIREQVAIGATGELDEFAMYRACKHSYYMSDDALPKAIAIAPGGAGELRRQTYVQADRHGVPAHRLHNVSEVTRLHGYGATAPIYAPTDMSVLQDQVTILVEQLPVPCWIVGDEYRDPSRKKARMLYAFMADMIAYWLWQFTPSLKRFIEPMQAFVDRVVVQIDLTPSEPWNEVADDLRAGLKYTDAAPLDYVVNTGKAAAVIRIKPSVLELLKRPDNSGERQIMATVLSGVGKLIAEYVASNDKALEKQEIEAIIDKHAPLGIKKKFVMVDSLTNPLLDERGLPEVRKIQEVDEQCLLDDLAAILKLNGVANGAIHGEAAGHVINQIVVPHLYGRLERTVATLKEEDLVDYLITCNEASVHDIYHRRLMTPTRMECFANDPSIVDKLSKELAEAHQTAMATRFLLEYVVARPPTGLRPISLEMHDSLLALASGIIEWGLTSDMIKYKVAEITITVLGSGRIATNKNAYYTGRQQFMREYSISEARKARGSFADHWRDTAAGNDEGSSDQAMTQKKDGFAEAFEHEFGIAEEKYLDIIAAIVDIGEDQDTAAKSLPKQEFLQKITSATRIPAEQVARLVEQIKLAPREDFLELEQAHRKEDIYPWRFNRELSYIRRPLVATVREGNEYIHWGRRHFILAVMYLKNLCDSGRLQAKSAEMKKFISTKRNQYSKEFNDRIYDLCTTVPDSKVRRRISSFCGNKMMDAEGDLGDIDVLAANLLRHELLVIECKNLEAARTPYEMENELSKLFLTKGRKQAAVKKLERRCRWVENNIASVLTELGIAYKQPWTVRPLIATSEELMSPYMNLSTIMVRSERQLIEEFRPNWL